MKQFRKRILCILAAAALSMGGVLPQSTPFSVLRPALTAGAESTEDFSYTVNADGTGVTVVKWIGTGDTAEIPGTVDGIPVTEIGSWAFFKCTGLTSVSLPDSVTSIGSNAFNGCEGLTEMILPAALKSIDSGAFISCTGLTGLVIPDGVTSIGVSAFGSCAALKSIVIPESVSFIGGSAFSGTAWLSAMQAQNPLVTVNDILIDGTAASGSVNVSSGVTCIADLAFSGCRAMTDILLPDTVKSIGESAFVNCSGLKSVPIPERVTVIGSDAFNGCTSLTEIEIPDSVEDIGGKAFFGCEKLASVKLPAGLTAVRNGLFQSCSALAAIQIPAGVKAIENMAFLGCVSLTEVVLPDGVQSIGMYTFARCSGLKKLTVPDSVTSIDLQAFIATPDVVISGNAGSYAESYAMQTGKPFDVFSGVSLTLSDDLGLNFCVRGMDAEEAADYKMIFSGACEEDGADTALCEKQGRYCATANVSANNMGKDIIAQLYKMKDEKWEPVSELTYSVSRYLNEVEPEADWSAGKAEAFESLRKTVVRYGAVSHAYFSNPDDIPAVTNHTGEINAVNAEGGLVFEPSFASGQATLALVLNAKLAVRLYVKNLTEGEEAVLGKKTLTAKKAENGKWYFEVTGIKPTQLADKVTVTFGGTDYSFAPLSWCYRVVNQDGAPDMDTAMANILYEYYANAAAFVNA